MGKPIKDGIDYFPLDVDMDETEEKIFIIEAECENERGFGILIKLLMRIYKSGYYIHWSERVAKIFAKRKSLDVDRLNKLVEVCVREGFFNKKLYEQYGILTSHGIQKRYFKIASRRSMVECIEEYLLIDVLEYLKKENVNILSLNANNKHKNVSNNPSQGNNNPENVDNYPTRKERKKGKKEKKREKEMSTSSSLKKPPPEEYDAGIKSLKSAIGPMPEDIPGKSKEQQIREVAARLKKENPKEYKKFIKKHKELQEIPW